MLVEALKIKLTKLRSLGKRVRVLVTTYQDSPQLRENYKRKYLGKAS